MFRAMIKRIYQATLLTLCGALFITANVTAEEQPLADKVEALKEQVVKLNRDLFILEEDLLFPATTQVTVYLSVDTGEFFKLDSVELKLDNERVAGYLYTDRQVSALHRGGIQRLFIGNLKAGKHELTAFFTGFGPDGREYRRGASLAFEKGTDAKVLELQVRDATETYQPEFKVVEWQ
ncbi:hypothetical protein ACFSJ3_18420 [Corallincola platygyrae]|uniref:AraC family transcriptional regulator n=1 Tax=Corallincola platygyrae TaxID=1193278 RepID=A0ABW4XS88_9GAMM